MSDTLVQIEGLTIRFKGVVAADHVNMKLEKGKIYGLIGTNGAGKSTVINMISGHLHPTEGSIIYEGRHIEHWSADKLARAGIARTFQNLRIFGTQTVLTNVITACQVRKRYNIAEMLLYAPRYLKDESTFRQEALEYLKIMKIEQYADIEADNLAYGLQRRLEIARCLALKPKVLLLDEPAAGMNPQESLQLVDDIKYIRRANPDMVILLIEHDMKVVMNLCEYIYVMASGKQIAEGTPEEIYSSKEVVAAYLGGTNNAKD